MDGAASCAPGRTGAVVRTGLTALLWLLVAFGVGVFSFFYLVTPTRWFIVYNKELIEFRSSLVLPYNFKLNSTTGRTNPILSGTISFLVSYFQFACYHYRTLLGWQMPRQARSLPVAVLQYDCTRLSTS